MFYFSFFSPAPGTPVPLSYSMLDPDESHGPRIKLTWQIPAKPNGVIRSYTVFYSHDRNTLKEIFGNDTLSYSVDVLGGVTYQFHVRAVTIKPGPNATSTINVPEYSEFCYFLDTNIIDWCTDARYIALNCEHYLCVKNSN